MNFGKTQLSVAPGKIHPKHTNSPNVSGFTEKKPALLYKGL